MFLTSPECIILLKFLIFRIVIKSIPNMESNTKLVMFNGNIKTIKDIIVGDVLLAHDGSGTQVIANISSRGNLYTIHQEYGQSYTIFEDGLITGNLSHYDGVTEIGCYALRKGFDFLGIRGTKENLRDDIKQVYERLDSSFKYPNSIESIFFIKEVYRNNHTVIMCNKLGWFVDIGNWTVTGPSIFGLISHNYSPRSKLQIANYPSYGNYNRLFVIGSGRIFLSDYTVLHI